jgi:transcriptional regulator with XRE-family HTH domain
MAKDVCERFGERLKALRKKRGLSQIDLAVHTGLSRTFISDLEVGRKEPCLRTLEILALGFKLSLGELLDGKS